MKFAGGNFSTDPTFDISRLDSTQGDVYMSPFSASTHATAEEAWQTGPSPSVVDWVANKWANWNLDSGYMSDIIEGKGIGKRMTGRNEPDPLSIAFEPNAPMPQERLEERIKEDFYAKYMTLPKGGLTEWEYDFMLAETRERMMRQSTIARAPDTLTQDMKNFGISLAVGVVDPTNVIGAFLPRFAFMAAGKTMLSQTKKYQEISDSIEKYGEMMDGLSSAGRAGQRLKYGAMESVPGAALVELPIYHGAQLRGEDYGAADVLRSIAMGIVIDTAIHVGGGALYDVATIPDRKLRREAVVKREADKDVAAKNWNDMLNEAYLENDNFSTIQRFQSQMSPADRAVLTQTVLAQAAKDLNIDVNTVIAQIQAKMDDGMTPGQIRLAVLKEYKQRWYDDNGTSMTREEQVTYDTAIQRLDGLVTEKQQLEASLEGRKAVEGKLGKKKAEIRDRMNAEERARLEAVNAEIETVSKPLLVTKSDTGRIDSIDDLELSKMPLNFRQAMFDEINQRVAASRDANTARQALADLGAKMEAPESKRTYVKGAETTQARAGVKPTPEQEIGELAQQAADAEQNATLQAEQLGIELKTDEGAEAVVKDLDDMESAYESLGACMGSSS
jgi:hypothetical protein